MTYNKNQLLSLSLLCSLGMYMVPGQASTEAHPKAKNEHAQHGEKHSEHEGDDSHATIILHPWVTVGPLVYLDGATLTVKNDHEEIIGRCITNVRGTCALTLPEDKAQIMPLHIRTSGGKAKDQPFLGHLEAQVSKVGLDAPIVFFGYTINNSNPTGKMETHLPRSHSGHKICAWHPSKSST